MVTIRPPKQDRIFGLVFSLLLSLVLPYGFLFSYETPVERGIWYLIITSCEAFALYCLYVAISSRGKFLKFSENETWLIIKNGLFKEERIDITDIVSLDESTAGRIKEEIITYRSRNGGMRKYSFVPYDTPEVIMWHKFVHINQDYFNKVMTAAASRLHNEMDDDLKRKTLI